MSLEAMTWAWRQPVRGTKKLVLLYLADLADEEHLCWPGTARMSERCGVGRSAIFEALRSLEDDRFIARDARYRLDGSQRTNLYLLNVSGQPDDRPAESADESGESDQGVRHGGSRDPSVDPVGEKEADASKEVDPVEDVWATYVEVMEPRRRELDPESRRIIRDALKVADVAELKRAIVGNKASSFHQGANERGKKYNALSQILKGKKGGRTTREQIDFFIEIADKSGASNPGLPSVDQAKLASAKRWVLTAWEYPGNAQALAASKEATEWLQQHGYAVEHDPADGRPIFRWLG